MAPAAAAGPTPPEGPPPPPAGGEAAWAKAWRGHPRLRRHVRRFREHPQQAAVLERYRRRARALDRAALLRHSCHVGAWVALLPPEAAALPPPGGNISPTQLLARLLRLRGRSRLTPWLRGILHLVALRIESCTAELSGAAAENWRQLRRSVPSSVWKKVLRSNGGALLWSTLRSAMVMHYLHKSGGTRVNLEALGCIALASIPERYLSQADQHVRLPQKSRQSAAAARHPSAGTSDVDHTTLHAVRQCQRLALARVGSFCGTDRQLEVQRVIDFAAAAMQLADAGEMVKAVVLCVGLLAPPRGVPVVTERDALEHAESEVFASRQARLRAVLVRLLRNLDVEDAGTRKLLLVPLAHLRHVLANSDLERCVSSKHWGALTQALGLLRRRKGYII